MSDLTVQINDKQHGIEMLASLLDEYKLPCCMSLSPGEIRSLKSNDRYWTVVVKSIRDYMRTQGIEHTLEQWHEFLKIQCFGKKTIQCGEFISHISAKSRRLTQKQFNYFVEWSEWFAIENLGVPDVYFSQ